MNIRKRINSIIGYNFTGDGRGDSRRDRWRGIGGGGETRGWGSGKLGERRVKAGGGVSKRMDKERAKGVRGGVDRGGGSWGKGRLGEEGGREEKGLRGGSRGRSKGGGETRGESILA